VTATAVDSPCCDEYPNTPPRDPVPPGSPGNATVAEMPVYKTNRPVGSVPFVGS